MDAKSEAAAPPPSYKDFEPFCEWQKEKDKDILVVQLPPGFKKEHLRVLVSNQGLVRFSGECDTSGNTRSRFQREIRVAKDCYMSGIQAKFMRGHLHIIMPKNLTAVAQDQAAPTAGESQDQTKLKQEEGKSDEEAKANESEEGRSGAEGCDSRLKTGVKIAMSGLLVVAVVVVFVASALSFHNFINATKNLF